MGVAGGGRGQRLEAEALEIARAAGIPRIGNDEAAGFVKFAKGFAFVGGAGHGGSPGETADRAMIAQQGTMTFRDAAMSAAHAGQTLAVARQPVQNSPP